MAELSLAEEMEMAALAAMAETDEDCPCGGDPGSCDCDEEVETVVAEEIAPEAMEARNIVIQLPEIPLPGSTTEAELEQQRTRRMIYSFAAVLAVLILLIVAVAVFNRKKVA